jgi:hypothetical protein
MAVLTKDEVVKVMDPANYTGGSGEIVDKMVSVVEEILDKKVL